MTDIAWPKAGTALTQELLDLIQQTQHARQIRKGANEVTKALNRGVAELLVLAADAEPLAILLHLPPLCEDKNVPYVYLPSKVSIGRACGVSRQVIAVAITSNPNSDFKSQIDAAKNEVEKLMV